MINVLIADDHTLVRDGLKRILAESPHFNVVAEAADGAAAMQILRAQAIELALFDLSMPDAQKGRSGVDLIKQAKTEFPNLRILVLTMHEEDQYALRAIRAGASGYLTKDCASTQLLAAMDKIARGGIYISGNVAEQLAISLHSGQSDTKTHQSLSDREHQVFLALVAGGTVGEIANRLNLSVKTVSTHKLRMMDKLQRTSMADLMRYAMQHQLLE